MAEYIFDGNKLKKRSGQKEGQLDKTMVKDWKGAQIGKIEGKDIRMRMARR